MQYLPEIDCELPSCDILTLLFDSSSPWAKDDTVVFAEAADETNHLTKAQTANITGRLAYILRHRFGIGAQGPERDVVTCISSNQILLPTIFFSVIGAGGIFSAASTALRIAELSRQISESNSGLIITSEDSLQIALSAAERCNIPPERVLVLCSMGHKRELTNSLDRNMNFLEETRELPWERITSPETLRNRIVALLYSSGTTGVPKGVPKGVRLSHQNLVAQSFAFQSVIKRFLHRKNRRNHVDFHYRTIAHLPTAHIAGLQGYFINGIMAGGSVFWMPKFNFDEFVHAAKKHQITFLTTVPAIYMRIVKSPRVTDHFDSLVYAQAGAAPMGMDCRNLFRKGSIAILVKHGDLRKQRVLSLVSLGI